MKYEPVIGLEVHAQLQTRSKMFCRCSTQYAGAEPNTHICPVCAGFPGVLPVVNGRAVELATRVGLALNCEISPSSRFDRKHYPYPDLPKGYQISQYDLPLAVRGYVMLAGAHGERRIGIVRVHMEEDTGRLLHRTSPSGQVYSLVDLNRSGVPLLEIVSEPDISSAAEAREYVAKLRQILRYIDASTGNMEEGALRCDANVSVRPEGETELGAKVEIKNLNSFRMIERAIEYEIRRQVEALESGEGVQQETRGWDEAAGVTLSQRTKEYASDYRYFPEPDLPPVTVDDARREEIRSGLAELPDARRRRFVSQYGLTAQDAGVLTLARETAEYFEAVVANLQGRAPARLAATWVTGPLFALLNRDNLAITETRVSPALLAQLLEMLQAGEINRGSAGEVLEETYASGRPPREVAQERGLTQISDAGALVPIVRGVLERNPKAVEDFRNGKRQVVGFLIGQVMKETRGTAKQDTARSLILEEMSR
jgi:aspartyl-tRNA(Asn)/glutamyl-tRNA(Gln) amidotransferase subunit B